MNYDDKFNQIVKQEGVPPPPKAVANYLPYRLVGNMLILSGQAPFCGQEIPYKGKVGTDLTIEEGQKAARLTGLNLLYVAQEALGTLDRVKNIIELEGMVNCSADFTQQSAVIDGCSNLMVEIFGKSHGKHARSAVGQIALAFNIATEIKMSVEIEAK